MKFRNLPVLILLLLLLVGCNGGGGGPNPNPPNPPQPPDGEVDPVIEELLRLHNGARTLDGNSKLHLEDRCLMAAKKHAQWMAKTGRMSHTGEGGSSVGDRLRSQGYKWTMVGENIARGYPTAQAVFNGWMNSSGHRRNILNGGYAHVGFGYADGNRGRFWCAVFARSAARAASDEGPEMNLPPGLDAASEVSQEAIMIMHGPNGETAAIPASAVEGWNKNMGPGWTAKPYEWPDEPEAPLTAETQ